VAPVRETGQAARLLTEKMRFTLGQPETEELATLYEGQPAFVVPSCCHHLDKLLKKSREPRMVICIDQFEEIVDDLADEKSVPEWNSLLGITDHLAAITAKGGGLEAGLCLGDLRSRQLPPCRVDLSL